MRTDRLDLRPMSVGDLDAFADFVGDPEATRWLHTPETRTREQAAAGLERWAALFEDPVGMYGVHVRESGQTAGFVGFVRRELDWGPEIELGWLLRRGFWGRGYATEAARALRPLVQGRVVSMIRVENEASQNVARKLGMTRERELEYVGFRTYVYASESAFEQLVQQALDALPADLAARMSNVAVVVEDEPPPGENLLGLYRGVPLTRRGSGYAGMLPDTITIYRRPLERHYGSDPERLVREVRRTVLHEIAHHFGISDERLIEIDRY